MDNSENKGGSARTFDGGVTEAQIAGFKAKYGKVVRIDVVDGEDISNALTSPQCGP